MTTQQAGKQADRARSARQSERAFRVLAVTVAVVVALPAVLYLAAIPLGWIDPANRRLGVAEAGVFASILAFSLVLVLIVGAGVERLSISGKGLEFQLRKVQDQVSTLRFLISAFVSDKELGYLNGLAADGYRFDFTARDGGWNKGLLQNDLRRMRSLGLIRMRTGKTIGGLPDKGNLADHCRITDRGEEYLTLRHEVELEQ